MKKYLAAKDFSAIADTLLSNARSGWVLTTQSHNALLISLQCPPAKPRSHLGTGPPMVRINPSPKSTKEM